LVAADVLVSVKMDPTPSKFPWAGMALEAGTNTQHRATEMDVTMIGLQNAGKTSLLRVLSGGEFTVE